MDKFALLENPVFPHLTGVPAPPLDALILVRTRRQAMDWSLVLASQGNEHIINHDDKAGWTLAVSAEDHEKALALIRLYRQENCHWLRCRPVFQRFIFRLEKPRLDAIQRTGRTTGRIL